MSSARSVLVQATAIASGTYYSSFVLLYVTASACVRAVFRRVPIVRFHHFLFKHSGYSCSGILMSSSSDTLLSVRIAHVFDHSPHQTP